MTESRAVLAGIMALLGCAMAPSCSSEVQSGGDSSSHWLRECTRDIDCGGLSCLCGVCTRACDGAAACASLSKEAVCGRLSVPSCNAAKVCVGTCDAGVGCVREAPEASTPAPDAAKGIECAAAPCGKGHGPCCAGAYCSGFDFYQCGEATHNASFCQQNAVGNCYPVGTIPCDPRTDNETCPSSSLFGSSSSTADTCCAPLGGTAGVFGCTNPATNPLACAPDGKADSAVVTGTDAASVTDGAPIDDGTCAFACSGACAAGRCVVTLAKAVVTDIAVDGTSIYWTAPRDGTVIKLPLGGGSSTTLASGQPGAVRIAVDATSVYVANQGTYPSYNVGSIVKLPISGGPLATLASFSAVPRAMALDAQSVYWITMVLDNLGTAMLGTGTVMRVPLGGGSPTTLATGLEDPLAIAVANTAVYVSDSNGIVTVSKAGGSPTTLRTAAQPTGVAVDSSSIYFTGEILGGPTSEGVWKMDFGGGSVTTLASWTYAAIPGAVTVDATNVYWVDGTGLQGLGSIMKVPVAGGTPVVLAWHVASPQALAMDGTSVYWTTSDAVMKVTPK